MKLFDTHFHVGGDVDLNEYYDKSREQNVEYFMSVGADYEESIKSKFFANNFENVWYTAGAHPHHAKDCYDSIAMFDEFEGEKLKAVGEIGLDYFYENSDRKVQRKVFEMFLESGLKKNLPVVIHCRDKDNEDGAYSDCFSMVQDFVKDGGRFEVHCYTGEKSWMEKFIDLGGYIGVTGIITFPRAQNVRDLIPHIPNDRLLLETDAPYLAPVPYRGKTNSSAYIIEVARKVASEKVMPIEELVQMTTKNAHTFFNIR